MGQITSAAIGSEKKFDAAIVGAGPAGVSCALWLKQLGFNPILIDGNDRCGGLQLSNPYTNTWVATSANVWGKDVAAAMHENMLRHQIPMLLGSEAESARIETDQIVIRVSGGQVVNAKYLVLAGGVSPKTGGYAGRLGLLVGPGPAVAETSFTGKCVAILGGGDSAFENYRFVKERGAASVTIYARTIRARAAMLNEVPADDVVVGGYEVNDGEKTVNGVPYDQILVLYGYEANKRALLGLEPSLTPDGFVVTDKNCLTSIPHVYAIGEIARRAHPCCVTAMADGVTAAKAIQALLEQAAATKYLGAARRMVSLGAKVFAK